MLAPMEGGERGEISVSVSFIRRVKSFSEMLWCTFCLGVIGQNTTQILRKVGNVRMKIFQL